VSAVRVDGSLSDWFTTTSQGCILSPVLFNIVLKVVTAIALDVVEFIDGSEIAARVLGVVIQNLCFADDISRWQVLNRNCNLG